jgi:hypothetical protein
VWDCITTLTVVFVFKKDHNKGERKLCERSIFPCLEQVHKMTKEKIIHVGSTTIFFPLKYEKKVRNR